MSNSPNIGNLVIAIGASAGGLAEIVKICKGLPEDFDGTVVVALHRAPVSDRNELAGLLARELSIDVSSVFAGETLCCATVFVGKATETTKVVDGEFETTIDKSLAGRMSRIDDLFSSVAEEHGKNAVGVILSGTMSDGADGLTAIRNAGGRCLVQTPSDATYDEMPEHAIEAVEPEFIGTAEELRVKITQIATDYDCVDCCD